MVAHIITASSLIKYSGFQTMSISEVFGEFRCGKTQMSHTMSVIAQLPKDMGGAEGKVAYIGMLNSVVQEHIWHYLADTEGTFRPERIAQIAERFGLDPEASKCKYKPSPTIDWQFAAQDNITYARAVNSEHQMELLNKVAEFFVGNEYRLLIIDSIMALFRVDYTGRGELNERQQKLNQFLSKLTHVAEGKNSPPFLATLTDEHQNSTSPCSWPTRFRVTLEPVLSSQVLMAASRLVAISSPTLRLLGSYFAKVEARSASQRYRTLQVCSEEQWRWRSANKVLSDMPEKEATYIITNGGINDPEKVWCADARKIFRPC
jgi:meiotic recombination protein DMC1